MTNGEDPRIVNASDPIRFTGASGAQLSGLISRPEGPTVGAALIAHCFTCSKELHTVTRLSKALVGQGWLTMTFDFTGLGGSDGDFGGTTVTTEIGDISRAAVAMLERDAGPCLLIGHSLGGAAAILAAHRLHTLEGVVAIASPAEIDHVRQLFGDDGEATLRTTGCATLDIGGRPFRMDVGFLDDLDRHDVLGAAAALDVPLLVVEAGADTVVPRSQTRRLALASPLASLVQIAGADHLFSGRGHADELADAVIGWLGDHGRE